MSNKKETEKDKYDVIPSLITTIIVIPFVFLILWGFPYITYFKLGGYINRTTQNNTFITVDGHEFQLTYYRTNSTPTHITWYHFGNESTATGIEGINWTLLHPDNFTNITCNMTTATVHSISLINGTSTLIENQTLKGVVESNFYC